MISLAGVPAKLTMARAPGSAELLAEALLRTGLADSSTFSHDTSTDAFVEQSLATWGARLLPDYELRDAIELELTITSDVRMHPGIYLRIDYTEYLPWRIGPALAVLSSRSQLAAATLLFIIERQFDSTVYGPRCARARRALIAEMEAEIAENDGGDESTGDTTPYDAANQDDPFEPLMSIKLDDCPNERDILRPHLDPPCFQAVDKLLAAEAAQIAHEDPRVQLDEVASIPLYLLHWHGRDATYDTFAEEYGVLAGDETGSRTYAGSGLEPASVAAVFLATEAALRTLSCLETLRQLTHAEQEDEVA